MSKLLKMFARRLAALAAALVILLAIAVGAFRLLLPQLPAHEGQIKRWAEQALGLQVDFARLDARWGWQGPELTFFDARVGGTADAPLLAAERASAAISLRRLITHQELRVDRLTLSGTDVLLERTPEGTFTIQGQSLAADGRASGLALDKVPQFQVVVQESRVRFLDHARGGAAWQFTDAELKLQRKDERVLFLAQAALPEALGKTVNLSAEVDLDASMIDVAALATGPWRLIAELREIDLAGWSYLLPGEFGFVPDTGRGDVSLWVEFLERAPVKGTLQVALADVGLPGQRLAASNAELYDNISLMVEWEQEAEGWRVGLTDMAISRAGQHWPTSDADLRLRMSEGSLSQLALRIGFARIHDLAPAIDLLPDENLLALWKALSPEGDVRNLNLIVDRIADGPWNYAVEASLVNAGVSPYGQWPGLRGVTAEVRADNASGSVDLSSRELELNYPGIFGGPLPIASLSGILVWRQGRGGLRLVGDDVAIDSADFSIRSSLELTLPADGSSPVLEMDAGAVGVNVLAAKRYLPVGKMRPKLVKWLRDSILAGDIPRARMSFFGPVRSFPFANGEGQFRISGRVENGRLRFAPGWMAADNISADVEFANAGLDGQVSYARILNHVTTDTRVTFKDLRKGVMTIVGHTQGPLQGVLDFLKTAPVTAARMGGRLGTLSAPSGYGRVALDLLLPLTSPSDYQLNGALTLVDGEIALEGLPLTFSKLNGQLVLDQTEVSGKDIAGELLGSPLRATVTPLRTADYRSRVSWNGPLQMDALTPWLSADLARRLSGATQWRVEVLLPDGQDGPAGAPTRIKVVSDLQGVGVAFPAPFDKAPEQPLSLVAELGLAPSSASLEGQLGALSHFVMDFSVDETGAQFRRGNLRFGDNPATLPAEGIIMDGQVPALIVDEWIPIFAEQRSAVSGLEFAAAADLNVTDLRAFGQQLGTAHLLAVRRAADWRVDIDSEPVVGTVTIPSALADRPQLVLDMQRLHLVTGDGEGLSVDPRKLPGAVVVARDFSLGERKLGELNADITADPLGLTMQTFATDAGSYGIRGSGHWITRGDDSQSTRIAVTLNTTDVAASLDGLGYMQGMLDGAKGQLTADVSWDGSPTADWTRSAAGEVSLSIDDGSVYAIEPGAGRVVGLMSIAALPRRLALDFRDVFQKGLRFDKVRGSFLLIDGNAYTNNLKLEGPVAEIGIIGRTGLKDRDYRQQAVVTAETGKMLPAVGGILAGPGVGAALLLFTQIFKDSLKGIGRASYCVTGSWEQPSVERLTPSQLTDGSLCIDLPPERANAMAGDVGLEDESG